MELAELVSEAEKFLRDADPLCVDANAYFAELRLLIEQATILWSRILFLHAAQQDQLQNMGNVCLVIRTSFEKMNSECRSRIKAMKRNRNELRSLLALLKQTKVDRAFAGHSSLFHYVHEEDVSNLESQVDVLADQLTKNLSEIEAMPDLIQQQLSELRARSPKLPPPISSAVPEKMVKMTQKAAPFANDMAELLTSLTHHYDLCSQIPQLSGDESAEATEVVMADRKEAANALERLKTCRNQLRSKHREAQRLQHSLAMTFENLRGFEDDISAFLRDQLRPALTNFSVKGNECDVLLEKFETVTAELSGLTEYYRLFKKSYHALVIEVARRSESSKQLRKIVENANNALNGFRIRESEARQTFVDTYQEFLPPEIWSGMLDVPNEYTITLHQEQLPDLSKSSMVDALQEIEH